MHPPFRYRRLGYVELGVTDLDQSTAFAVDVMGLDRVGERRDGARFFRSGTYHHDVVLAPHTTPSLVLSSWELENAAQVDAAFAHFAALGWNPTWLEGDRREELRLDHAFRVVDRTFGKTWEYFSAMTFMPAPRSNPLTKFQGGKHIGLVSRDAPDAARMLQTHMGFVSSDYFEGSGVTFLRAWPNPNHHSLATFGGAEHPQLHHLAFMVQEIDDVGRLFNRARNHGAEIQFGIGRHPTSGSIHLYLYDADNFVWEYTLGMEQFPESGAREARRMSCAPEDFDLWGAIPDWSRAAMLPRVQVCADAALRGARMPGSVG